MAERLNALVLKTGEPQGFGGSNPSPSANLRYKQRARDMPRAFFVYTGHDTSSGVKVSNEPVRRNQIVEDKFAPAREWMKEVQDETRRTRTGNGYKAHLRASRHHTTKPQP